MEFIKYSENLSGKVNAVIIPLFEDAVPRETERYNRKSKIIEASRKSKFNAKKGETFEIYNTGTETREVLVGLGKKSDFNLETLRRTYSSAFISIKSGTLNAVLVILPGIDSRGETREAVFAISLASYDFDKFRGEKKKNAVENVFILTKENDSIIHEAKTIANAVNYTRDIANLPPSVGTPTYFEKEARKIPRLEVTSFDRKDFVKLGMGGLEGVSRAAHESARLVIMEYGPKKLKSTLIVGKGITFDSGGISIKPSEGMEEMKFDKCGASAVLGIMKLISDMKMNVHVIGIMPLTENLPGGNAYKPGDILVHYNGVTSEVLSTDAEGRLVLADALSYGIKNYNPGEVIDLATLTGACVVALGNNYAGMMGNDDALRERIRKASEQSWEKVWDLPIDDDFQDQIKSKVADIKNTGGREGGAETAAAFLSRFVGRTPWVHLDIAGTAWTQKNTPKRAYLPPGATGYGVRLLYEYIKQK
jgi:leucyl aminopeptidase